MLEAGVIWAYWTHPASWLDAAAIEKWLLAEAADLLPNATLKPIVGGVTDDDLRVLASLPLRLVPGRSPRRPSCLRRSTSR